MADRDYEVASAVYPDPRTLYEKDEWFYESPYRMYRGVATGVVGGIIVKMGHNWAQYRPMRAGLHMYPVYAVIGAVSMHFVQKAALEYYSYKDRITRHYIATHPDDFPPPPKVKVGEVWEPWHPTR